MLLSSLPTDRFAIFRCFMLYDLLVTISFKIGLQIFAIIHSTLTYIFTFRYCSYFSYLNWDFVAYLPISLYLSVSITSLSHHHEVGDLVTKQLVGFNVFMLLNLVSCTIMSELCPSSLELFLVWILPMCLFFSHYLIWKTSINGVGWQISLENPQNSKITCPYSFFSILLSECFFLNGGLLWVRTGWYCKKIQEHQLLCL